MLAGMRLLIVGAGGYGQLVREIAELNGYAVIDFLDDNNPDAVGKVSELEKLEGRYDGCIVAIGNPNLREKLLLSVCHPAVLVHPKVFVSKSAVIEPGCVIEANAVINTCAVVRSGSYVCAGAVVNHNAVVNECCQIDCNAVVAAGAVVPAGTKVESCTVWKTK